jgi:translation initiation factor IF-1
MRLKLLLAMAVIFVLVGMQIDRGYQRSTPEAVYVRGTVIGFERPHRRQVYPIFEFTDENGQVHHVVNSSQQAIVRFATGDAVPVAYSRLDPQRARIDTLWFNHRWAFGGLIVALTLVFGALTRRESGSDQQPFYCWPI